MNRTAFNRFLALSRFAQKRHGHGHHVANPGPPCTFDLMPVPHQPYKKVYGELQSKFNTYLAISAVFFVSSVRILVNTCANLNVTRFSSPPPSTLTSSRSKRLSDHHRATATVSRTLLHRDHFADNFLIFLLLCFVPSLDFSIDGLICRPLPSFSSPQIESE